MEKIADKESIVNSGILGIIMLIFGLLSFIFGLGLFSFRGQPIYFEIAKLLICSSGLIYIISGIFLFRLKTTVIFGLFTLLFGAALFLFQDKLIYPEISNLLILISGLIYIISSIFLFRLKKWSRKLIIGCSTTLLFYFIPLAIYLFSDPWGWGGRCGSFASAVYTIPFIFYYLSHASECERAV